MRRICIAILMFMLAGCALNKAPQEPKEQILDTNATGLTQAVETNATKPKPAKLALNNAILSTFHTILSCADCDGIKTILTLNKDKSYEKIMLFLRNDAQILVEEGSFKPLENSLKLTSKDGKTSFYAPKNGSLIQLDEKRGEPEGVLAEIYKFEPINRAYKESFFAQWSKFEDEKSFQKILISPSKNGAKFSVHTSLLNGVFLCELDGQLRYERGILYFEDKDIKFSIHRLQNAIFIKNSGKEPCQHGKLEGKYIHKSGLSSLFSGHFFDSIAQHSQNADIVRSYGAKNIKKDISAKDQNRYVVLDDAGVEMFKFELTNGVITRIDVLSSKFHTPEGVRVGMRFADMKKLLKPENFAVLNGKISLKFPKLNAVFKLDTAGNVAENLNLSNIPNSAQISEILLFWND